MSMIKITYKNTVYSLEFTRKTASLLESNGFRVGELMNEPNVMIPLLVKGAFLSHHSKLSQSRVDEIYHEIKNKDEFIAKLIDLYMETTTTLTDDNEQGNATWEMA